MPWSTATGTAGTADAPARPLAAGTAERATRLLQLGRPAGCTHPAAPPGTLSEEQRDALQEFRDSLLDNRYSDASEPGWCRRSRGPAGRDEVLLVRINDLMEHISRVLAHARRLEDSIESAVQIHFRQWRIAPTAPCAR